MYNILLLNGPNLNLLGEREPDIYGNKSYKNLCDDIVEYGKSKNVNLEIYQSNHEGEIIDLLHNNKNCDGVIINPAAYTHTSIAIYDALKAIAKPVVEVHLSNIFSREGFRSKSVTAAAAIGSISGFGSNSYNLAVDAIIEYLDRQK